MAIEDALRRWQEGTLSGVPTPVPRVRFDRRLADGTREIGWRQDGYDARMGRRFTGERVVWTLYPDGSATWWDEGWSDGNEDLSVVHRFDPQALLTFRTFATLSADAWDGFPFEAADFARMEGTVRSWQDAEVLSLYYSLWTFDPPPCGACSAVKPVPGFTPPGLYSPARRSFASPLVDDWQWGILNGIWRLRTDLRSIRDPATGAVIDGIVDPAAFPHTPCNVSCSPWDAYIQIGLTILTIGSPVWASAMQGIVSTANQITQMRDAAARMAAYRNFADAVRTGVGALASGGVSLLNPQSGGSPYQSTPAPSATSAPPTPSATPTGTVPPQGDATASAPARSGRSALLLLGLAALLLG